MSTLTFDSPIGKIRMQASESGISQLEILGKEAFSPAPDSSTPMLQKAKTQLGEYFSGLRKSFDLPLDWSGMTEFQHRVLLRTCEIPFGKVLTYGGLAKELGKPAASRAVGAALGSNPIPLLIPCHRVVAADGSLTGYSAAEGIKTKRWLLELEGRTIVREKLV